MSTFISAVSPRNGFVWAGIALGTLGVGGVVDAVGLGYVGLALWVSVAAWYVIASGRGTLTPAAIAASIVILAFSESVVSPGPVATVGPLLVLGLVGGALAGDATALRPLLDVLPRSRVLPLVLLLAFAVLFVASTVATADTSRIAKAGGIAAMWAVLAVAGLWMSRSRGEMASRIEPVVLAIGLVQVAISLLEAADAPAIRTWVAANAEGVYDLRLNTILGDWTIRTQGTFGYPIPLAAFLAVALVVVAAGRRPPLVRLAVAAAFMVGIMLTGSRSGLIAAAAGVSVVLLVRLWEKRGTRDFTRTLGVLVGVTVLGLGVGMYYFVRALSSGDFSLIHRSSMVSSTFEFLLGAGPLTAVFGVGYGGVERAIASGDLGSVDTPVVDNAYLSAFLNSGILGGLIFVGLVVVSAVVARWAVARGVIVAIGASFFFFDAMQWHAIAALFCVTVGAVAEPPSQSNGRTGAAALSGGDRDGG